jgi:hypothetical protein
MAAKPCFMCEALEVQWVLWANWRGDLRHFCDDECLRQWLDRCLDEVSMDAMSACRQDAAEE